MHLAWHRSTQQPSHSVVCVHHLSVGVDAIISLEYCTPSTIDQRTPFDDGYKCAASGFLWVSIFFTTVVIGRAYSVAPKQEYNMFRKNGGFIRIRVRAPTNSVGTQRPLLSSSRNLTCYRYSPGVKRPVLIGACTRTELGLQGQPYISNPHQGRSNRNHNTELYHLSVPRCRGDPH